MSSRIFQSLTPTPRAFLDVGPRTFCKRPIQRVADFGSHVVTSCRHASHELRLSLTHRDSSISVDCFSPSAPGCETTAWIALASHADRPRPPLGPFLLMLLSYHCALSVVASRATLLSGEHTWLFPWPNDRNGPGSVGPRLPRAPNQHHRVQEPSYESGQASPMRKHPQPHREQWCGAELGP